MKTEIEVKFLSINHDSIRDKLKSINATCVHPMRNMRRITIDTPDMKTKNAYIRVRDQGDKVVITYKQFDSLSLHGAKEIEMTVDNFESAVEFFNTIGLPHGSYQESKREEWKIGDVEVVLDEWPWLDTYIEIEGPSEDEVKDIASKLGLNWDQAVFGDVMSAYKAQYPHLGEYDTVGNLTEVKFGNPLPDLFRHQ